jgi:hypothetical protein
VNEKYRPAYPVDGYIRAIVAGNNDHALRYQRTGTLTESDVDAIADRLLVLTNQDPAATRAFLESVDTDAWADRMIAEHALYLAATVGLEPKGKRMCARPANGRRLVMLMAGARYHGFVEYLREVIESGGGDDVTFRSGAMWVREKSFGALAHRFEMDRRDLREGVNLLAVHGPDRKPVRRSLRAPGMRAADVREWFEAAYQEAFEGCLDDSVEDWFDAFCSRYRDDALVECLDAALDERRDSRKVTG